MKIRHGFVSNSSSSSFVVMMKKEHFDKAMEAIHPYYKACIEALGYSKDMFFEDEMITIGTLSVMDCSPWEYVDVNWDDDVPIVKNKWGEDEAQKYDSVEELINAVQELYGDNAVITCSLDG